MFWRIKATTAIIFSTPLPPWRPCLSSHRDQTAKYEERMIAKSINVEISLSAHSTNSSIGADFQPDMTVKLFTSPPSYIWLQQLYGFKCRFDLALYCQIQSFWSDAVREISVVECTQYRALLNLREKLTPENRSIYDEFSRFRNASLWNRLAGLYHTGLYRKTLAGNVIPFLNQN